MRIVRNGISLIVLIITIIIIIILAGVIINSITNNNQVKQATKAELLSNVDNFKSELELYKQKAYLDNLGNFDPDTIQADNLSLRQNGKMIQNNNIYTVIPSLKNSEYLDTDFVVVNGKLEYRGINKNYQDWLSVMQGIIVDKGSIIVSINSKQNVPIKAGNNVEYDINISSAQGLKQVDKDVLLAGIKIVDNNQKDLNKQPNINIVNFSCVENSIDAQIIINTEEMNDGQYTIKLEKNTVENKANKTNDVIIDTKDMFDIDNTAPESPVITSSITVPTNQDVTVKITYPSDAVVKQYSYDGKTWNDYINSLIITDNCTVYAIAKDNAGNESSQSTFTISNIDKEAPTAPTLNLNGYISGKVTSKNVLINFSSSDIVSGIYKYEKSIDGLNNWEEIDSPISIQNDGNYEIYIRAIDNAGNISNNSYCEIIKDSTNPTISVNEIDATTDPVDVTISYPKSAVLKKYKIDSGSWNDYDSSFKVSKNCTIYAISYDYFENESTVISSTINNIYKISNTNTLFDDADPGLRDWSRDKSGIESGEKSNHILVNDVKYTGASSIKVYSNDLNTNLTIIYTSAFPTPVKIGKKYSVVVYSLGSNYSGYIDIWGYNSDGTRTGEIKNTQKSIMQSNGWIKEQIFFDIPSNIVSVYFDFVSAYTIPGTAVWWDNAQIFELSN